MSTAATHNTAKKKRRKVAPGYKINIVSFLSDQTELTLPDGARYCGAVNSDGFPEGKGRACYSDGGVYEGHWHAGDWHGSGVYTSDSLIQRCESWLYGQLDGLFEKESYGEQHDDFGDLCFNIKMRAKSVAGQLCGRLRVEGKSCCGSYHFLCVGRYAKNSANGFGYRLNFFSTACADGHSSLANYGVGIWKDGELQDGIDSGAQSDGSWLREVLQQGCVVSRKSSLRPVNKVVRSDSGAGRAIASIKTNYRGYTFQSRTEARWAIFFQELGVCYLYEPYKLQLDGKCSYTCDFMLPYLNCWVEVKGGYPTNNEVHKAVQLCRATKMDVHFFYGCVGRKAFELRCCNDLKILSIQYRKALPPLRVETQGLVQCSFCSSIQICSYGQLYCSCGHSSDTTSSPPHSTLNTAFSKARTYIFD